MTEHLWIGIVTTDEGQRACNEDDAHGQVDTLLQYDFDIKSPEGDAVSPEQLWVADPPDEPPILNHIVEDRRVRVDEGTPMADRPPFAIATIEDDTVVRLEYYAGHDALSPAYDLKQNPDADLSPTYSGN